MTREPSYQLDCKSSLQANRLQSIQIRSFLAQMKFPDVHSLNRLCGIRILLSPRAILTLKAAGLNTPAKDRVEKRYSRLEPELVCYQSALQPLPIHLAQRHLGTMHGIARFLGILGDYRKRSRHSTPHFAKHLLLLRLARFHLEAMERTALLNVRDERYRERWHQRALRSGQHLQTRLNLEAKEKFAQLGKMEREHWYRSTGKHLHLRLEEFYLEAMRRIAHFPNMLHKSYRERWVQCSHSGKNLLRLRPCLDHALAKLSLVVSNGIGQLERALGYVVHLELFDWCT